MSRDMQKRRSSIQNPHVQQELRNINLQDMFRNIPELQLQNITRLSGNSLRGSGPMKRSAVSGIPTPQKAGPARRINTGGKSSRTPATGPSSGTRGRVASAPRSTASKLAPPPNPRGAFAKVPLPIKGSFTNLSQNFSLNSTRRKSKSFESLLQTPAFTPAGRSRSKSPGALSTARRRGMCTDPNDQAKNIKVSREKKVQAEMSKYIFDFMERHDCPAKPGAWKELMNPTPIPTPKFWGMIKFVASLFVGEDYFVKGEDEAEKMVEVSKLLKYPGQLSKSHLKTATAQHAWPTCLTYLCWLCCRAQALFEPEDDRNAVFDLANNGFMDAAFQSFLNLYPYHFSNAMTEEVIADELNNFRERVHELHTAEVNKTTEELMHEKNEKLKELEKLNNETDPAKELRNRLDTDLKRHASIKESIREAENKCKKYSSVNHILLEKESLEMQIETKRNEIKSLELQVASQPLSQEAATQVRNETAGLKKQVQALLVLNAQLKTNLDKHNQMYQNSEKMFYEVWQKFSVVERYNDIIRSLQLVDLVIPANPFQAEEFREWLKAAGSTLRKAQRTVSDMVKNITASSEKKSKEAMDVSEQIERLRREIDDYQTKLVAQEEELEFVSNDFEIQYQAKLEKVAELREELKQDDEDLKKIVKVKTCWATRLEEGQGHLERFKQTEQEQKDKVYQEFCNFKNEEISLLENVQNLQFYALQQQQTFYQEAAGINIFGNSSDED
ncbi:putative kinetochore protein NDC80 [Orchesella cincta]|uniref:Kinetochore protein NDC80 n=1 Tax=Orchesella cincta TaxID=48709 RepID=A0A1D2NGY1_ORCCI|nr:putative kinetochore protein NDC80 [Orchesella cincta]